jgi:WD40 repeat protein
MGHPVTLFGESHVDRRERLREVIAALELDDEDLQRLQQMINQQQSSSSSSAQHGQGPAQAHPAGASGTTSQPKQREIIYSNATESLIDARRFIADYSFAHAHARISQTKRARESEENVLTDDIRVLGVYSHHKDVCLNMSVYADERPCVNVRFSPINSEFAAMGSLSCGVKIFSVTYKQGGDGKRTVQDMGVCASLRGVHTERVSSVAWHPHSFVSGADNVHNNAGNGGNYICSEGVGLLASASADSSCALWKCSKTPIVDDVASAQFIGQTSMNVDNKDDDDGDSDSDDQSDDDKHKQNMDVDVGAPPSTAKAAGTEFAPLHCKPILRLTGHSGPVNCCEFHPSGRLVGTASAGTPLCICALRC